MWPTARTEGLLVAAIACAGGIHGNMILGPNILLDIRRIFSFFVDTYIIDSIGEPNYQVARSEGLT